MKIALIGEYIPTFEPHRLTIDSIEHAKNALGISFASEWVSTEAIGSDTILDFQGFWIAPGSPYKNMEKTLSLIRHAREKNIPCLGTCGGFQHMIIEYARNALGYKDAEHAEYDPYSSNLIISRLACSLFGREMELTIDPVSITARIYCGTKAIERYYCNFGINPEKIDFINSGAFRGVASDPEGEVRVMELPSHPFFIGTLFVPQAQSRPNRPHPLIVEFLRNVQRTKREVR